MIETPQHHISCNVVHEKFNPADTTLDQLLEKNHAWAKSITSEDPAFFQNMALGQTPKILWIGKDYFLTLLLPDDHSPG